MDKEDIIFVGILVSVVSIAIFSILDVVINEPYAAQIAQENCIDRGFDNYYSFSRPPLSREAYGIKCKYENKYVIEDGGIIVDDRYRGSNNDGR